MFFCSNLNNKKFCIKNKVFDEKEYFQKKEEILKKKDSFSKNFSLVNSSGNKINSKNSKWNFLVNCEDVLNAIKVYNTYKAKNVICFGWSETDTNIFDCFLWWTPSTDNAFAWCWVWWGNNIFCSQAVYWSSNMYYSLYCNNCSYCLGCIGLKNKSFCILNKQYSKEERFEKANEIFAQMEKDWQLWKFFPPSMNPFLGYLLFSD